MAPPWKYAFGHHPEKSTIVPLGNNPSAPMYAVRMPNNNYQVLHAWYSDPQKLQNHSQLPGSSNGPLYLCHSQSNATETLKITFIFLGIQCLLKASSTFQLRHSLDIWLKRLLGLSQTHCAFHRVAVKSEGNLKAYFSWAYHASRFNRDSPGLKALSRRPGQSTKKSRLGIQSDIMNNMRSDNKSRMLKQNVKALITCKINTDFSWCDFYEKIKSSRDFLKKVLQSNMIGLVLENVFVF